MTVETWYVMEDGSVGDPAEIVLSDDGRLVHADGRKVAYGPHGPRSRGGVDAAAEREKAAATRRAAPAPADRELKTSGAPAGGRAKTQNRGGKAR